MSNELTDAIVNMQEDEALGLVKRMLDAGTAPTQVLEQAKEAMTELGRRFECEEAFIPELIMGGEIMRGISEELKPHLKGSDAGEKRGTVVIGTVKGDIHDIGKDIVVMMLDINGYEVYDLGVDVPHETFVEAIKEHKPEVVGLSGLLTLAFDSMKGTVDAISAAGLRDRVKIMVGGAPADQQVQDYTGSDGWGSDVAAALKLADAWTGKETR
jgi:methanogenic corrinoid protein MtbC1